MHSTSHITPHHHLPLLLFLLGSALVDECFGETVAQQEHDALTALKLSFGNPLLSANWSGSQCTTNNSTWFGIGCTDNRVTSIALQGLGLSGRIDDPLTLAPLTELALLSLRNNLISGPVLNFSFNLKLTSLDLSANSLTGPISDSLLRLNKLELLQLSDNKLNGSIPPFNQTSLRAFNVSNNELTGEVPTTTVLQSFNQSSYLGNPGLCGEPISISCQCLESANDNNAKNQHGLSSLKDLFIVADFVLFLALSWSLFALYSKTRECKAIANVRKGAGEADKNRDVETNSVQNSIQNSVQDRVQNSMQISIQQRVEAAEEKRKLTFVKGDGGFDLDHLLKASAEGLGKGSFGSCYKAALDDGRVIVVKRLRDLRPLTKEEFIQKVSFLGALEHPNLMPLLGYYYSPEEKLLVYNFATKGNLFNRIHRGRGTNRIPFKWSSRLAVAVGVARAVEYLHLHLNATAPTAIPHGNLRSPNVLLDEDDAARVADYGLIPLVSPTLAAQRMAAYRTPEYDHQRKVSKMSDVWSYGCLLLELLTGRSPGPKGGELHHWVHRAVREEWTGEVLDREIATNREAVKGMFDLLKLALSCCEVSPDKRPDMGEVVRAVEKIKNSMEENDSTDGSSLMDESGSSSGTIRYVR